MYGGAHIPHAASYGNGREEEEEEEGRGHFHNVPIKLLPLRRVSESPSIFFYSLSFLCSRRFSFDKLCQHFPTAIFETQRLYSSCQLSTDFDRLCLCAFSLCIFREKKKESNQIKC